MLTFNEFTRIYQVQSKEGVSLYKTPTAVLLDSHAQYMDFIRAIDHYSTAYYNVTKGCNFRCTYCYSHASPAMVTMENHHKILQAFEELNVQTVTLIGGEPYCHPQFGELLQSTLAKEAFQQVYVITNGSQLHRHPELLAHPKLGLRVSLDGYSEETNALTRGKGNFEPVYKNLLLAQKNCQDLQVMRVVTAQNIADAPAYYDFFTQQGFEVIFFVVKQVEPSVKPTVEQLTDLMEFLYDRTGRPEGVFDVLKFADQMCFDYGGFPIMHCGAGINSFSVLPDGTVYPCVKRECAEHVITNLLAPDGIDAMRAHRKKTLATELVTVKPTCCDCDIRYTCGGGCRSEEISGMPDAIGCEYYHLAKKYYESMLVRHYETV